MIHFIQSLMDQYGYYVLGITLSVTLTEPFYLKIKGKVNVTKAAQSA